MWELFKFLVNVRESSVALSAVQCSLTEQTHDGCDTHAVRVFLRFQDFRGFEVFLVVLIQGIVQVHQ